MVASSSLCSCIRPWRLTTKAVADFWRKIYDRIEHCERHAFVYQREVEADLDFARVAAIVLNNALIDTIDSFGKTIAPDEMTFRKPPPPSSEPTREGASNQEGDLDVAIHPISSCLFIGEVGLLGI